MSVITTDRSSRVSQFVVDYGIFISFAAIFVALSLMNEYFLSSQNLLNVMRQISINGVLAVGMTFVILTGGIDLSVGSILAFAGMVAASLVPAADPHMTVVALLAAIAVGAAFGLVNGSTISLFSLPPFVVTLGMLSGARGATLLYSDGRPIATLADSYKFLGQGTLLGLPVPVIAFAIIALLGWMLLRFTVFGRYVYAVGGNARSARTSGVSVRQVTVLVYVIMGSLAGLAGALLTARTSAAVPQAGLGYELDAIAAVVIGGTSLTGGVGRIGYTIIGVLIIGMVNNGLDLMGVSSYYQQIIKGFIIVLAVLIDKSRHQH
ncbi:ABC transporter permease [Rhizobium sp. 18055]|uniref:ABC transporter permease n=1 Tax=Rhizobium sp. 18055 TaxID=2681403 RepID=UPI001FCEDF1A|nr:ABC transporter permease [Rhizobium sp. 18055]